MSEKVYSHTLSDGDLFSTYGTSFQSFEAARDFALRLRKVGLCRCFRIGRYKDQKWEHLHEESISLKDMPKFDESEDISDIDPCGLFKYFRDLDIKSLIKEIQQ